MKFSMNGFRQNLTEDVQVLRDEVKQALEGEHCDKESLLNAMNSVICNANALNCVFVEGDPDFTDMGEIEVDLLEAA